MLYQLSYIGVNTGCQLLAIRFRLGRRNDDIFVEPPPSRTSAANSEAQQSTASANLRSQKDVPDNQNRKDFRRCVPLVQVYFSCAAAADNLELAKGFEPPTL